MEKFINILSSRGVIIFLAILLVLIKAGFSAYDNQGISLKDLGVGAVWAFTLYCFLKFGLSFAKGYITGKRS